MILRHIKSLIRALLPKSVLGSLRSKFDSATRRKIPRFKSPRNNTNGVLECCIAYTESGGFCVPLASHHRPAAQMILRGSVYEPQTIEFLVSNCKDGDIVHAGTYYGDFLPALSRACSPEAKVWAFEPNPENFRCAVITCAINGLRNIELENAGLGIQQETVVMVTRDSDGRALGGASQVVTDATGTPSGHTETVNIVALDNLIPIDRNVSIIQLDVEGYEKQALSGGLKTISRCLPILVLETLPDESWLSSKILQLGYTVGRNLHGNTVLTPPSR